MGLTIANGWTVGVTYYGRFVGAGRVEVVAVSRRVQTLLFTDIVGSTDRLRDLGDAAWAALLVRHHGVIRAVLAAHGGREVDTAGDGFLARFDAPAPAVQAAAAAVLALAPLDLEIRAGLHTGEVELGGGRVAGVGVHLAARVMAEAGAGQVLVTSTVRDLMAGSGFGFVDLGVRELKGFAERWRLFPLDPATVPGDGEAEPSASEPEAEAGGRSAVPFPGLLSVERSAGYVGREGLLGRLEQTRRQAADGACRAVLLCGEPGVGKTRRKRGVPDDPARSRPGRSIGEPDAASWWGSIAMALEMLRGGIAAVVDAIGDISGQYPDFPAWWVTHAVVLAMVGRAPEAREVLTRHSPDPDELVNDVMPFMAVSWLAWVPLYLDDAQLAGRIAATLRPFRDRWAHPYSTVLGPITFYLAMCAATTGDLDESVALFEESDRVLAGLGCHGLLPFVRLTYAEVLLRRGSGDQRGRAVQLLDQVRQGAATIRAPDLVAQADELAASISSTGG